MPMIQQFGEAQPGVAYVPRPGGYVVLFDRDGNLAAVMTPGGLALPGGGQEPGETPEHAAVRETREECGLLVRLGRSIGVADELVFADDEQTHYRKRSTFFLQSRLAFANGRNSTMSWSGWRRGRRFRG